MVPEPIKPPSRPDEGEKGGAPVDLQVGDTIAGKYSIERLLGRGGMGTVWLCTHRGLGGEHVAVKVMAQPMADNAEVRARFEREARASAKIKSRYAARVHDAGELPDGRPYLVMEYMEGETLGQALQRSRSMSLPDTARILGQVGRGLARAHELGIVHRDIKPDNVFLAHTADDGVIAKVFDFGIVKVADAINVVDDTTQEGALLGTPQYMSPEQVEGTSIDLRADVYALGVMAYRMLTGKRLFPSDSLSTTLMRICNGPLPKLTEALTSLPPAMEDWFQRTCARDREQRYESAVECVDALATAAGVATTRDVAIDGSAGARPSGSVPPPEPLETPTGLSAVQRTAPPAPNLAAKAETTSATTPEMRRKIAVIGGAAATLGFLALLAFLLSSRESRTGASAGADAPTMASVAPPAASTTLALPPPPVAVVPAAPMPPPPIASARPVTAPPDVPPRASPRPSPPRRSAGRPRGDAPPPPPADDRIHDVGY